MQPLLAGISFLNNWISGPFNQIARITLIATAASYLANNSTHTATFYTYPGKLKTYTANLLNEFIQEV